MPRRPLVRLIAVAAAVAAVAGGCTNVETPEPEDVEPAAEIAIAPDVEARLARFEPTEIRADLSALSDEDRRVLGLIVEASRWLDPLFLRQVWQGNPELEQTTHGWNEGERGAARDYFELNFGPWDRLEEMEPFLGETPHPPGAGYYPDDLGKDAFEAWLAAHPDDRDAFTSTVTVIRRDGDGPGGGALLAGLRRVPEAGGRGVAPGRRRDLEPVAEALPRTCAPTPSCPTTTTPPTSPGWISTRRSR